MGVSFVLGAVIYADFTDDWISSLFVIFVWPVPLVMALATLFLTLFLDVKIFRHWWAKTIKKLLDWNKNRKEDKLFYEKHLDNKFERSGIKFDEKGDIIR